ncbi:hypothetical protein BDR26DRAFT_850686 [Obelidium mucronatum]|nr:hypothetical protein BDR26DRAFT_850686 [Obelidium mucronatum]
MTFNNSRNQDFDITSTLTANDLQALDDILLLDPSFALMASFGQTTSYSPLPNGDASGLLTMPIQGMNFAHQFGSHSEFVPFEFETMVQVVSQQQQQVPCEYTAAFSPSQDSSSYNMFQTDFDFLSTPQTLISSIHTSPLLVNSSVPSPPSMEPRHVPRDTSTTSFCNSTINPLLAPKRFTNLKSLENEAGLELLGNFPLTPHTVVERRRRSVSTSGKFTRFKPTELEADLLNALFQKNPFPSAQLRKKLADRFGLDMKQVQFWFQNRRAAMKMSGIHVLKPRKADGEVLEEEFEVEVGVAKRKVSLSPLCQDSPFFYVEKS